MEPNIDAGTIAILLKMSSNVGPVVQQAVKDIGQLAPGVESAARTSSQALDGIESAASDAAKALDGVDGPAKQAASALNGIDAPAKQATQGMSLLKASFLGFTLGSAVQQAPQILAGIGRATFMAASDMSENINKVKVVFGEAADGIRQFASDAAQNLGLSESAALGATGTFGNLFVSMGMVPTAAADMSMGIVQLAADLASFNNIGTDEALEKLRAGLVGETEPLRSLGVNLSAAAVQAKALDMGLAGTADALTAADKAQASYALILEQTKTAQGDFARTADGAANSIKAFKAEAADGAAKLGGFLLLIGGPLIAEAANNFPALAAAIGTVAAVIVSALVPSLVSMAGTALGAQVAFLGLSTTMGPLILVLAAVGTAVFLTIKYWDDIVAKFPIVGQAVDTVKAAFQGLVDFVGGAIPGFMSVIGGLATALVEWFTLPLQVLSGLGESLWKLFNRDFEGAWNAAKNTVSGIGTSFSNMKDGIEQAMNGVVAAVQGGWDAVTESTPTEQEVYGPFLQYGPRLNEMINTNIQRLGELDAQVMAGTESWFRYAAGAEVAWAGQQALTSQLGSANEAVNFWQGNLSNAEGALDFLNAEMERNGGLSAEQQRQYDILTGAVERYEGGIRDSQGAVVDAAVAQAEFVARQDELNGMLANGQINQVEYNRAMTNALGAIDPAAAASYGLAAAQQSVVDVVVQAIDRVEGLLVKLGLIPSDKKTDVSTPGAVDAEQQLSDVKLAADRVPRTLTIDAHVNLAAAQNALNELRGMTFTQSPPKEGPMSGFVPDWSYLFEGLVRDAEDFGTQAMQRIKSYLTGLDLGTVLDRQVDLQATIAQLEAVHAGLNQLGDTAAATEVANELTRLMLEAETLAAIVGTDAVQAWLANEDAAKAAAEAAEDALEEQRRLAEEATRASEAWASALSGIGTAGNLNSLEERYRAAQLALQVAILEGADSETLAALQEVYDAALLSLQQYESAFETALANGLFTNEELLEHARRGGDTLWAILQANVLTDEQVQELLQTGDEAIRALIAAFFGEEAVAAWEAGWNDLDQLTIDRLAQLTVLMENGGAEVIGPLVDAIAAGAIPYESALSLLSEATGEQVNEMIAELQRLEAALTVQLAEALLAGTDPTQIEQNLALIEQLLASLADRAVETAETVVKAGKSMGVFADDLKSGLEEIGAVAEAERIVRSASQGALGFNNNPGLNAMDRNGNGIIDPWELPENPPPWWQNPTPRDWSGTPWGARPAENGPRPAMGEQTQVNVYLDSEPIASRVERRLMPGRGLVRGVR